MKRKCIFVWTLSCWVLCFGSALAWASDIGGLELANVSNLTRSGLASADSLGKIYASDITVDFLRGGRGRAIEVGPGASQSLSPGELLIFLEAGGTVYCLGSDKPVRSALGLEEHSRSNLGCPIVLYALRYDVWGKISDLYCGLPDVEISGGSQNLDSLPKLTGMSQDNPEAIGRSLQLMADWVTTPPNGSSSSFDPWDLTYSTRWSAPYAEFGYYLDFNIYKLKDNKHDSDWYRVETKLQTEIYQYHFGIDYIGYWTHKRTLLLDLNRYDSSSRQTTIQEHGPTSTIPGSTTGYSLGGSLSSDAIGGVATFEKSWSTPCIATTDLTSTPSIDARWEEDLEGPDYGLCPFNMSFNCIPARSTFYSEPCAIPKIRASGSCPQQGTKFAVRAEAYFQYVNLNYCLLFALYTWKVSWTSDSGDPWISVYANLQPEVVSYQPTSNPVTVSVGQYLDFSVAARDLDGANLTYLWKLDGTSKGNTSTWRYTPQCSDPSARTVECVVTDCAGSSRSQAWTVYVNKEPGKPGMPTVTASPPSPLCSGATSQLSASASGNPTSWSWSASCGTISGSGQTVTYTAPTVTSQTTCTISVTASNGCGSSSPGGYTFTINPKPGTPTITAICGSSLCSGRTCQLRASASGNPTSWSWSSSCGGSFNPPNGNPTQWTAPATSGCISCLIGVTASNACGATESADPLLVTVCGPPSVPANVRARPGCNTIAVSWDAVSAASSYNVYRDGVAGPYDTAMSSAWNDPNPGTIAHYYQVAAVKESNPFECKESERSSRTDSYIAKPGVPDPQSMQPNRGPTGIRVTIFGHNFGSYCPMTDTVYFTSSNGWTAVQTAPPFSWAENSITCMVPADAITGLIKIVDPCGWDTVTGGYTPVLLSDLQGVLQEGSVVLRWRAAWPALTTAFRVYRGFAPGAGYQLLDSPVVELMDGNYECVDRNVDAGCTYCYRLCLSGEEVGGECITTSVMVPELPDRFGLKQNHPNPFNPATTIEFDLPKGVYVKLRIFDVAGKLIRALVESFRPAGRHSVQWDGRDAGGEAVPSGVYICNLEAEGHAEIRKMVVLK